MLTKLLPLRLSHEDLQPFLCVRTITDSHQSLNISSFYRTDQTVFLAPVLKIGCRSWTIMEKVYLVQLPCLLRFFTVGFHFCWRTGNMSWFTCAHKWKVHCGAGPTKVLLKVFCSALQLTLLRVYQWAVDILDHLTYTWVPGTSIPGQLVKIPTMSGTHGLSYLPALPPLLSVVSPRLFC